MWFIFPQLKGLGSSATAHRFAIVSLAEARAYLAHPILGPRLKECTTLVLDTTHQSVKAIFPHPDDLKFHSSMTLFARAAPHEAAFSAALKRLFGGRPDNETIARLERE
jgi:uncharacterized protein (DUF1810 family)